jgi:hypothetical protein
MESRGAGGSGERKEVPHFLLSKQAESDFTSLIQGTINKSSDA